MPPRVPAAPWSRDKASQHSMSATPGDIAVGPRHPDLWLLGGDVPGAQPCGRTW